MMRKQFRFVLTVILLCAAMSIAAQNSAFFERLKEKGYFILDVENDGVKGFLNDPSYNDPQTASDYYFSIVTKYSKGQPPRPRGVMLSWGSDTPNEEVASIIVTLVERDKELSDERFLDKDLTKENAKYYYPDVDSTVYVLSNMCPNKYCYYKVEEMNSSGQMKVLKRGKFYTTGRVRMLRVEGMTNVRDFGGWHTSFGKTVAYGRLFRGSCADAITEMALNDFVRNEHITADLDLRGKPLETSPMWSPDDVEFYCTNNARYVTALTNGTSALAKDLNIIANVLRKGGNLFLHCNHGTNRAGTLSFFIEGILGLSEADLRRDYELSSFAYGKVGTRIYGEMLPMIRSYGREGDDLTQCFYNYARSIGVAENTLDTIRCVMLGLSPRDPRILNAHRKYKPTDD